MITGFFDYFKDFKSDKKARILGILFFLLTAFIFYIFFRNIIFSLFISTCLVFVFLEVSEALMEKRARMLNNQLIEFLVNMIVMLRAGKTVRNIITETASLSKPPLGNYLRILSSQLEMNISFDCAMDDFAKNCANREALLLATALKLNNRIGGDLVFILGSIDETLRDSLKLKSGLNIATLQGRYSGSIIAMLPVIMLIFMFFSMSHSLQVFFSTGAGNICLIAGAVLEISGIIVIRKILGSGGTDGI